MDILRDSLTAVASERNSSLEPRPSSVKRLVAPLCMTRIIAWFVTVAPCGNDTTMFVAALSFQPRVLNTANLVSKDESCPGQVPSLESQYRSLVYEPEYTSPTGCHVMPYPPPSATAEVAMHNASIVLV